ncbi:MAG TPA: LutB/LldF family L-lactate oxidation iron-sulfur protein [Alphaproteobacteria bacterium]|jgi:L-lactate dehydrogenase complex protein LldF|nr:LutB/LldF family L-lactate oxidation iron-sulfur protein [Alphaproteobacteria bacterium]
MKSTAHLFPENARRALQDDNLRLALGNVEKGFAGARRNAREALPEFDALRDQARDLKNHVLENLDAYLERFEAKVVENGGQVHWCERPEEANRVILELCRSVEARTVTKGKTMIAEETALNDYLAEHDIEAIETDLGEYIIQLADEPPSHIIAPAVHKTKDEVSDLFQEHHQKYGLTERQTDPRAMLDEARQVLRQKFIAADVGITGANFLIAETGTSVIVTNEGNGDLTQTLPKMHIVMATPEKLVPTLEDVTLLLRLLSRSATGQELSVYTTFSTGPRRPGDLDGPEKYHVVLLDNGRTELLASEFRDVLRCIKCGACLFHCPVYSSVGGHAYGWVYPGPMGAILTPRLIGLESTRHLPNASSLCGRCEDICPMRIPIPRMLRRFREQALESKFVPLKERAGLKLWAWFARRPRLYRLATGLAARVLHNMALGRGRFSALPLVGGWTGGRDLAAPEGRTFMAAWKRRSQR